MATEGSEGGMPPSTAAAAAPAAPAAPIVVPGLHSQVSAFDANQEDWIEYVRRLELYFTANDIANQAKKRAILLNDVGPAAYRLVKILAIPGKPIDLPFEDIVEKLKTHFNPKPSPIIKRYEFNTRKQQPNETVSEYVAALQRIAEHCEYESTLNDMLRDGLVCGIAVQDRYLHEGKLTYKEALEMAQAAETAVKDSQKLCASGGDDNDAPPVVVTPGVETTVQHMKTARSRPTKGKPTTPQKGNSTHRGQECHRCDGKHDPSKCRFKEHESHYCKKRRHLAAVCHKKKQADNSQKTEQAHQAEVASLRQEEPEYTMYHMDSAKSTKPVIVDVKLNGILMQLKVNMGASVSLMGEAHFKALQEKGASLRPSTAKLSTYTGEVIPVLGISDVKVEHNGQTTVLPLVVIPGTEPPLLGHEWLTTLQLD